MPVAPRSPLCLGSGPSRPDRSWQRVEPGGTLPVKMQRHVLLDDPGYRALMALHAREWRVESGSLPGVSVGELVDIEIAQEAEYTFWKPDGARVATLPIASTEEEKDTLSGWLSLCNRAAGISLTLSPSDTFITEWLASTGTRRVMVGSSTT